MNILIIGSGGREHALVKAVAKSPLVSQVFAAAGNAGILADATRADVDINDFPATASWCQTNDIALVIIGPEGPLVEGMADVLRAANIVVFGPSKAAAEIEGSKAFMKDIVARYGIPTAAYASFTDAQSAKEYITHQGAPIVVKTDGLAAGKGVIIAQTIAEAHQAVDEMMAGKFGTAGHKLVIEEFMEGEEASFFAICDGTRAIACGSAQDHKRVGEGDTGLNTGGMGTYSPAPVVTDALQETIMRTMIDPTMAGMQADGYPYIGFLFAGVMVTKDGPKLLEYNARFGDPEAQVVLSLLDTDIVPILLRAAQGQLAADDSVRFKDEAAVCVVMAANGYPEAYEKGSIIGNLDAASEIATVFHAGTKLVDGEITAIGGRVLGITAHAPSVIEAQQKAYQAVDEINWPQGFCRRDIAWRAINRTK